jgi:hypothetical protein
MKKGVSFWWCIPEIGRYFECVGGGGTWDSRLTRSWESDCCWTDQWPSWSADKLRLHASVSERDEAVTTSWDQPAWCHCRAHPSLKKLSVSCRLLFLIFFQGGYMNAKIQKLQEQFSSDRGREQEKDGSSSTIFNGVAIFVNGYTSTMWLCKTKLNNFAWDFQAVRLHEFGHISSWHTRSWSC